MNRIDARAVNLEPRELDASPSPRSRDLLLALAIFLGFAAFYISGAMRHGVWDRDEARYSSATREMLEYGDWVIPHFNGEIRYDKPILIYWLMAGSMKLFGSRNFATRLPSSLAAAATIALVFLLARRMNCRRDGALAAALAMGLSLLPTLLGQSATTDAVLGLTVVVAFFAAWEQRTEFSWARHFVFWTALAAAALDKGPIGVAVVGLGLGWFAVWQWRSPTPSASDPPGASRPPAWLRTASGLTVFLALTLPWVALAWERTDGGFFAVAFGKHVVGRATNPMEGHKGPFFYYLPILVLGVFPFSAPALAALGRGWSRRAEPVERFLLSWIAPGFVLFSAVATKLPHYIYPLLPPVFVLFARWWDEFAGEEGRVARRGGWRRAGAGLMIVIGAGIMVGGLVAAFDLKLPSGRAWLLIIAAGMLIGAVAGAIAWDRGRSRRAVMLWGVSAAVSLTLIPHGLLARIEPLRPTVPVVQWIRTHAPANVELIAVEYQEPTLVYYWGRGVNFIGKAECNEGIERLKDASRPAALVTSAERWEKWRHRYTGGEIPDTLRVVFKGDYYMLHRGEPIELVVVANWPDQPGAN